MCSEVCKWKTGIFISINSFCNLLRCFLEFAELAPIFVSDKLICSGYASGECLGRKAKLSKHTYWYYSTEKGTYTQYLEGTILVPVVLHFLLVMVKLSTINFAHKSGIKVTSEMGKRPQVCYSLISIHWLAWQSNADFRVGYFACWMPEFPSPLCPLPIIASFSLAVNICTQCLNLDAAADPSAEKKLLRS